MLQKTVKFSKSTDLKIILQVRKSEEKARISRSLEACKTPRERPLVLPGGRKWYNPKDAFNEESIAEIISSQAELINGSTLGWLFTNLKKHIIFISHFHSHHYRKFESPFLGYDDRWFYLNWFMKHKLIHFLFPRTKDKLSEI